MVAERWMDGEVIPPGKTFTGSETLFTTSRGE
jgi:hypothetical protein